MHYGTIRVGVGPCGTQSSRTARQVCADRCKTYSTVVGRKPRETSFLGHGNLHLLGFEGDHRLWRCCGEFCEHLRRAFVTPCSWWFRVLFVFQRIRILDSPWARSVARRMVRPTGSLSLSPVTGRVAKVRFTALESGV